MHLPKNKPRLVIFDVEGVLIPKYRFIFNAAKCLGASQLLKVLFIGVLYEIGIATLKSTLQRIFHIIRGLKVEVLAEIFDEIPLKPRAAHVIAQLKMRGFKIALISSGLPMFLVEKLAGDLGADYAFGIEVGVNDGKLTGEIYGDVIEADGKRKVLSQILVAEALSPKDCVVIADDRNNLPMFLPEMLKIGYNPDFPLRLRADEVVNGSLTSVLSIIEGRPRPRASPSKNDILRETIHACGFFVPLLTGLIGVFSMILLICTVSAFYLFSEFVRLNGKSLPIVGAITQNAASEVELHEFAAAPLYFAMGILLTLLLFPLQVSSAAIAIFALGDSTASLFGSFLAKKPLAYNKSKTLEGSLFGLFFAFLAGCVFVTPLLAFVGAFVAMAVESLPSPVNDNISIPLYTGLVLMLIASI
ncbi:MAG: HAD-IB family phosphatase [Candidatus Bathyarchaeota archaeon]|nr:HAD-IB family phosphatase [Candidatus Bathyarchaeota archaeon]